MATEKRLIPLNKRIVYAGDVFNSLMAEKKWSATEASDFIKKFHTVDAVKVVRCKECKWYTLKKNVAYNGHFCDKIIEFVKPDDFCSFAERRTND